MNVGSPDMQIEFVLHETSRLMRRLYNECYRKVGLNSSKVSTLIYLDRAKEGMIQTELSELLEVGKAATGTLVDSLENEGLIVRHHSKQDRRVRILKITEEGRKLVAEANQLTADIRQKMRSTTTKEERRIAIAVIDKIRTNLKAFQESDSANEKQ